MKLIRNIEHYQPSGPLCLALGNFDGVHLGHQQLIKECVDFAARNKGTAAAYIFDPHPARVIKPSQAPKLLVTTERKAELLESLGLNLLIYAPFTPQVAQCAPEEFVRQILVEKLNVQQVVVGFNYSFGFRGAGTPELLKRLGDLYGFKTVIVEPVEINGRVVSSSVIRQALELGNIEQATEMLGDYPVLSGLVVKGEQRGQSIGFPTANLSIDPELTVPGSGVYAAVARIDDRLIKAVVNIGRKPTFHEEYPTTVEAHLIDFKQDIYGKELQLTFIKKIRDERKFSGVDELVTQIKKDCQAADKIAVLSM
jgi:riboflavin kinase/FMN adenylyltransferase